MPIILNQRAFDHAKKLIAAGEVEHGNCTWSEHQATRDEIDKYLNTHDMQEYALWFLGDNTDMSGESIERYEFPVGDLKIVHRGAVIAIKQKTGQQKHMEIEKAADQLLRLIDAQKAE